MITVPVEFRLKHMRSGFPWCDTCRMPAVWSEHYGSMHVTPEHRGGVPKRLDESGHEVSMREWWDPGRSDADTVRAQEAVAEYLDAEGLPELAAEVRDGIACRFGGGR